MATPTSTPAHTVSAAPADRPTVSTASSGSSSTPSSQSSPLSSLQSLIATAVQTGIQGALAQQQSAPTRPGTELNTTGSVTASRALGPPSHLPSHTTTQGPAGIAATVPSPSALAGIPLIQSTPSLPASSTTGMTNRFSSTLLPNQSTATPAALIGTAPAPYPNAPQGAPIVVSPNDPPIPNKLAQHVWKGEYIDLSEFLPEVLGASDPISQGIVSENKGTRKQKVSSISQWVQCFNAYMSIVALKQPSRITDLLAYSSLIVQAHRKYSGDNWQVYDRNFRQQAAAQQPLLWAHIDPGLWTMAFANATANQHCQWCLSLEHSTSECPDRVTDPAVPICRRWNWMECSQSSCRYRHICSGCLSPHHKEYRCPLGRQRGPARPQPYPSFRQRSPPRPARKDYLPDRAPFRSYRGRDPR